MLSWRLVDVGVVAVPREAGRSGEAESDDEDEDEENVEGGNVEQRERESERVQDRTGRDGMG